MCDSTAGSLYTLPCVVIQGGFGDDDVMGTGDGSSHKNVPPPEAVLDHRTSGVARVILPDASRQALLFLCTPSYVQSDSVRRH